MAAMFIVSTAALGLTLYFALPTLDECVSSLSSVDKLARLRFPLSEDRPHLKIPKSFVELQALNTLLKKYRDIYPYRIVVCYVTTYLL